MQLAAYLRECVQPNNSSLVVEPEETRNKTLEPLVIRLLLLLRIAAIRRTRLLEEVRVVLVDLMSNR